MHELGIAKDLLRLVLDAAGQANLQRISRIEAKAHGFSADEVDSILLHWGITTKGTLAEGSELELTRGPNRASCIDCGWEGVAEGGKCAACGSEDVLEDAPAALELVTLTGE